jgi:hypothetical protein
VGFTIDMSGEQVLEFLLINICEGQWLEYMAKTMDKEECSSSINWMNLPIIQLF